jgi:gluconolactonase
MYAAPPVVKTTVFSTMPDELRMSGRRSAWAENRGPKILHSFLEGPHVDRAGNLYCVDIPFGRIFRISPQGQWSVVAEYDGEPNGLKIHKDGRLFVADHKCGLLSIDPETGKRTQVLDRGFLEPFRGLNDLSFSSKGDLYFTDPGQSTLTRPDGRVFRLRASGELDLLLDNIALPNGLVLDRDETVLFVAETKTNRVLSVPLRGNYGGVGKTGVFVQMSGGAGPDGMALDESGNLCVVHAGRGIVWIFDEGGEPILRVQSNAGPRTTNCAYGGEGRKTLFITEADTASILEVKLETPGVATYGLL